MRLALSVAALHGLVRVRRGWFARDRSGGYSSGTECHAPQTVAALVDRGFVQVFRHGEVAHLTELGLERFKQLREEIDHG